MKALSILAGLLLLLTATRTIAQNPLLIKQVNSTNLDPGNNSNRFYKHQIWNNKLFYYQSNNLGLCVTDGTNAGTQNIFTFTIPGGAMLPSIMFLGPAQDFMYIRFRYYPTSSFATITEEIWKSDGTTAGTQFIYSATTAAASPMVFSNLASTPDMPASIIGNTMFFRNTSAAEGTELWKTDGTPAGTGILKDIRPGTTGSSPVNFGCIGYKVLFYAGDGVTGRELWSTDGTAAGTVLVKDINPGTGGSDFLQANTGVWNGKYFFHADIPATGAEPWVSDGTEAGTFLLKDIVPGTLYSIPLVNNEQFVATDNHIYFKAKDANNPRPGVELWRTDGTTAGTILLSTADSLTNVAAVSATGGNIYFMIFNNGNTGTSSRQYFLVSDGTVAGTRAVDSSYYFAAQPVVYKNGSYCSGTRGITIGTTSYDNEILKTDGTRASTGIAIDVYPGITNAPPFVFYNSGIPQKFFKLNNYLYFFGRNAVNPFFGLFRYDGDFTFNGTVPGGRWRDSLNWNSNVPPGLLDTVHLNNGAGAINVDGRTAAAGVLNMQNGVTVNLVNATDSLQIGSNINTAGANSFTGNGVISLKTFGDNTLAVNGGFTANRLHLAGNTSLQSGNINVAGNFNLTNGKLFLNNNNVQLTGNTSTITNNATSYIVTNGTGRLSIADIGTGGRTGTILFPVGSTSFYNPAGIENTGTADIFSVRTAVGINGSYSGETPGGGTYASGAVNNTWFVTEATPGGSNVNLNLQWNQAQELPAFDRTQSYLGHYTSGAWNLGTPGNATGPGPYTYSRTGITSFSPFGILNSSGVLPLQFTHVAAQKRNSNNVCVDWKTANEINVSHFVVERSLDGQLYTPIATVPAQNRLSNNYTYTDDIAMLQYSNKIYYRIKQADANGRFTTSNIVFVTNKADVVISVYPNPVVNTLYIYGWEKASALQLFTITGNKIADMRPLPNIQLDGLASGVYLLKVIDKKGSITSVKFNKQ